MAQNQPAFTCIPFIQGTQAAGALWPFPDTVEIKPKDFASNFAREIFQKGVIERYLVLWVDGSAPGKVAANEPCGAAVGYHDPASKKWKEFVTIGLLDIGSSYEAELLAIREGLRKASELREHFDHLIIFSDCQSVIHGLMLQSGSIEDFRLYKDILEFANAFFNEGISVQLLWVPSVAKIPGHIRVDRGSRDTRKMAAPMWPEIGNPTDTMSLIVISPESDDDTLRQLKAYLLWHYEDWMARRLRSRAPTPE